MDKRFGFTALVVIIVLVAGIALFYCWLFITDQQNSSPEYLNYSQQNVTLKYGDYSKIYLVNSTASFGTYTHVVLDTDPLEGFEHGAVIGEPYVYISGAIRNDDNRTLWVWLMASLIDSRGDQVGKIVRTNGHTEFLASYLGLDPGETGNFSITLKYSRWCDRKVISSYNIYLDCEPTEYPPT